MGKKEYEKLLLSSLERQVKEADNWKMREKANMLAEQGPPREVEKSTMPPAEQDRYDALKEDLSKMMAAAEDDAEKGNLDASKFKIMLADEVKGKMKELEDQYPMKTFTVTSRAEEVCEVCGVRFEALNPNNQQRYDAHFTGAVHRTYAKIREWIEKLKAKNPAERLKADDERDRRGDRDKKGDRDRDRDRRSRSRSKKRSRSKDKARSRSRDK